MQYMKCLNQFIFILDRNVAQNDRMHIFRLTSIFKIEKIFKFQNINPRKLIEGIKLH